jgi:hypothetical protein
MNAGHKSLKSERTIFAAQPESESMNHRALSCDTGATSGCISEIGLEVAASDRPTVSAQGSSPSISMPVDQNAPSWSDDTFRHWLQLETSLPDTSPSTDHAALLHPDTLQPIDEDSGPPPPQVPDVLLDFIGGVINHFSQPEASSQQLPRLGMEEYDQVSPDTSLDHAHSRVCACVPRRRVTPAATRRRRTGRRPARDAQGRPQPRGWKPHAQGRDQRDVIGGT